MSLTHKELTVQIVAKLKVGYNQSDLDEMNKSFRDFKHGIERLVKRDLLPTFQADPHSEVEVLTIGFPTKKKLKSQSTNQAKLKG